MLRGRIVNEQRVTFEVVLGHLRRRDFAVLSTVGKERKPHAVGVNHGVSRPGCDFVIYVMTRTHLQKAWNIAQNQNVSLVVPLTRRLLGFSHPPPSSFTGELRSWTGLTKRGLMSSGASGWVVESWTHIKSPTVAARPGSAS
jgi:Pyridoxamine 5'-phosphate oxidase